jgi:hypothetical protein
MGNNGARPPFHVGGENLDQRLSAALPELVQAVLQELVARIPEYGQLPTEEIAGDITRVVTQNLRSFIDLVRTATLPKPEEVAYMRESAARRADEGIPIDVVLSAYHLGVQVVWNSIAVDVGPGDVTDLMAVNSLVLRYLELITPAVAAGYLEQRQSIFGDEHSARHTLLTRLLEGLPPDEAAATTGLRLPPSYLVLAIAIGKHPDELAADVDAGVAARRKLRRLRYELERLVREPVLSSLTVDGGTALVPLTIPSDQVSELEWKWVRGVVQSLTTAAGADVTVGVAGTDPAGVSEAARVAGEVLRVAQLAGKPPGVYRLDDVLLEYQLSQPSEARDRLAGLLDPLDDYPELLETLLVYLSLGGRRPTASKLHLHPNTVDYRLRRVQALTGLDATAAADVSMLEAAITARRSAVHGEA